MADKIVLVDENNQPIGGASKDAVHNSRTRLHRGFSLFLFNSRGEFLLQQRSHLKKFFPLVWSNSVCGHPRPGETDKAAAKRRLNYELGLSEAKLYDTIKNYRYKAWMGEVLENEICPILVGSTAQKVAPNPDEVEATLWVKWQSFLKDASKNPQNYSPRSVDEARMISGNAKFWRLYGSFTCNTL